MEKVIFRIPSLHCNHCAHTINMELEDLDGVISTAVDINTKDVVVEFQPPASRESIIETLKEINYPPEE